MDEIKLLDESFAELSAIKTEAEREAEREAAEESIYVDDTVKKEYEKYYRTDNPLAELHLMKYANAIDATDPIKYNGRVKNVRGLIIEGRGPEAFVGEVCKIRIRPGHEVLAEVVGFERDVIKLMAIGDMEGIAPGCLITATGQGLAIPVGECLLGRVLDGIGRPIDNKGSLGAEKWINTHADVPDALTRRRVAEPLAVGVRAIDGLLTVGRGQRLGIFSGSGVGKSTLLSMMARGTSADVTVLALVGERGKEVRDFIERDLKEEGLARSVLVIATAEQEPLVRIRAAFVATTIAEYFRDQGKDVLLLMDSLTRFAQAQRQVGLSIGEPPTMRGFTPSVFSLIPKLVERAGTNVKGSITAFYTVLVEGDDVINDPVADSSRGHLDGHIVLSRDLAMKNHYPAIDIPASISRVMTDIVNERQMQNANNVREMIKVWRDAEDLINIGAYARGSSPKIDQSIQMQDDINQYLRQRIFEPSTLEESEKKLSALFMRGLKGAAKGGPLRRK
jgi:flagellum-specific ATP synthase